MPDATTQHHRDSTQAMSDTPSIAMSVRHLKWFGLCGAVVATGLWDNFLHAAAGVVHRRRIVRHARPDQVASLFSRE
jgi:hypothetical protein